MNTTEKHSLWELEVEAFDHVVLASELMVYMCGDTTDADVSQSLLKSFIAKSASENSHFAKCANCGCPVHFVARNATTEAHFRHNPNRAPSLEAMQMCAFYSSADPFFGKGEVYKGEGKWHFETKHFLAQRLKECGYLNIQVEKFIFSQEPDIDRRRKPDIAFSDSYGNRFVIELTRWWMNPEVVAQRERFFRDQGYNLIWLFSPDCEETNAVTLNLILYGSAAVRETASVDILTRVECNAFVLSDEARLHIESQDIIVFEVLYPVASFNSDSSLIDIDKRSQLIALDELQLDPTERLPFAICTSESFKLAMAQKYRSERHYLANQLTKLRQLALSELTFSSQSEGRAAIETLSRLHTYVDEVKTPTRFAKYESMATANIALANARLLTRQTRQQAAQDLKTAHTSIRQHLRQMDSHHAVSAIRNQYHRIVDIGNSVTQYQSAIFQSFLSKALAIADKRLHDVESHINAVAQAKQVARQTSIDNHVNEREAFIQELEQGFDDLPIDSSVLSLKRDRIVNKAKEYGFINRAEYLERIFIDALTNAQRAYEKQHYPTLSQGWISSLRYKPELDKAFALCHHTLGKRDPNKKRIESYQGATKWVLSSFESSLRNQIDSLYDQLFSADQPTFSALMIKESASFLRLRECYLYMNRNGVSVEIYALKKLEIIFAAIKQYQSGNYSPRSY